jgi:hypothetical protein
VTARTAQLVEAATKALNAAGMEQSEVGLGLTICLAAMLDEALPRTHRAKVTRLGPMAFTPKQLFDALEADCAHIVQLRPYAPGSFGRLGKMLGQTSGLEHDDLQRLVGWISSGGLSTWPTKPTWSHVCKHVLNWIAQARAAEETSQSSSAASTPVLR